MIQATDSERAEDNAAQGNHVIMRKLPPGYQTSIHHRAEGNGMGEVGHISRGDGTPWAVGRFRNWRLS